MKLMLLGAVALFLMAGFVVIKKINHSLQDTCKWINGEQW